MLFRSQEMALRVKAGTATVDEITRLIEFIKQNGGIEYAVKVMYEYKSVLLTYCALCRIRQ